MTMAPTDLDAWTPRALPGRDVLIGRLITIRPYDQADACALYSAVAGPGNDDIWTYMPVGPFHTLEAFEAALANMTGEKGWQTMVICAAEGDGVLGMASYMRLRPADGSVEVGTVAHGADMQRTAMSTEAHYLLARHVFEDLGYRRYEWKCNSANAASMAAATRYGFTYEGTFRQDMVVKGQNRDTAWFSMLDGEWPALKARFEAWLDPANFGADGRQRQRLGSLQRTAAKERA